MSELFKKNKMMDVFGKQRIYSESGLLDMSYSKSAATGKTKSRYVHKLPRKAIGELALVHSVYQTKHAQTHQ